MNSLKNIVGPNTFMTFKPALAWDTYATPFTASLVHVHDKATGDILGSFRMDAAALERAWHNAIEECYQRGPNTLQALDLQSALRTKDNEASETVRQWLGEDRWKFWQNRALGESLARS